MIPDSSISPIPGNEEPLIEPPYAGGPPPYAGGPPPYAGGPPPYAVPAAPRPGCVPLRPLGVGDILDGSFAVIRRNPRATLGLSAIVGVIQSGLTALFEIVAFNRLDDVRVSQDGSSSDVGGPLASYLGSAFGILVVGAVLGSILTGMLTVVVTQDVLGNKLGIGEVWTRIRPRVWALLGLSVLLTVAQTIGLGLCLAPGIWLWGIWAVAVPALTVEGVGVRRALGRSKQLVDGGFWRVWGIRALGFAMASAISSLVSLPFTGIALVVSGGGGGLFFGGTGGDSVSYVLITAIGSILAVTVTAPVRAAIDALLYVDLRMRREGLDIVLQQAAQEIGRGS